MCYSDSRCLKQDDAASKKGSKGEKLARQLNDNFIVLDRLTKRQLFNKQSRFLLVTRASKMTLICKLECRQRNGSGRGRRVMRALIDNDIAILKSTSAIKEM